MEEREYQETGLRRPANWIENDGTTASQVLDFKEKTVTVFLTFTGPDGTRHSQLLTGRLELQGE